MRKRKPNRRFISIFILFLIILCCVTTYGTYSYYSKLQKRIEMVLGPPSSTLNFQQKFSLILHISRELDELSTTKQPNNDGDVVFKILQGENATTVGQKLFEQNLLSNPNAFTHYLIYTGGDKKLQSGTYLLNKSMTPLEIGNTFQSNAKSIINFDVLPGWRAEQIGLALAASGVSLPEKHFSIVAKRIGAEGYLLPDSYLFRRNTNAKEIINLMMNNALDYISGDIHSGFSDQGLSDEQAVILASIVQREVVVEDEMPLIASVFLNRYHAGMKLEADPTVQYALGFIPSLNSWWKNPLSLDDLQIDSPYNTYRYPGLPPTPICNPGKNALKSIAFPSDTSYYYFRAKCDQSGRHNFSQTFEEHINNACP